MLFFAVVVNPSLRFLFVPLFVEVSWERYSDGAFVPHLECWIEPDFRGWNELDVRRVFGCGDVEARDFVRV